MRNIDNLLQTVYDETGVMGDIQITFDPVEDRWRCRIQEEGMVWLDDAGERYLSASDHDLDSAMRALDQLCAGCGAAR
jgi:predicted RNA-binding protein with PUA domain